MAKFTYETERQMDARDGNPFATTYYQQTLEQKAATHAHTVMVAKETIRCCEQDPDLAEWVQKPLKAFKRTGGKPNYSYEDIVSDLVTQLDSDKDIPSGMLGRWRRLFGDTDWDIELTQASKPPKNIFGKLFDDLK